MHTTAVMVHPPKQRGDGNWEVEYVDIDSRTIVYYDEFKDEEEAKEFYEYMVGQIKRNQKRLTNGK